MNVDSQSVVGVFCSVPDQACAEQIASALLEQRLAACVNIAAPSLSMYRWQGRMARDQEIVLFIKTVQHRLDVLQQTILALHPYEVPEIIVTPMTAGLPAYLEWVRTETRDEKHV